MSTSKSDVAAVCLYDFNNEQHQLVLVGTAVEAHAERLGLEVRYTAPIVRPTPGHGFRYRDGVTSVYIVQALGTLDEVKAHASRLRLTVEHFS